MSEEMIAPCPFCGTKMQQHDHCFSHPRPAEDDCILRHYSFDNAKIKKWNRRTPAEPRPADGEMIDRARKLIAIVMSHVQCTEAGATWLHATDAEEQVAAALFAYNPNERLREALELFVGQAVFDPYTRRASVDEFVVDKARSALSPLPQGEDT